MKGTYTRAAKKARVSSDSTDLEVSGAPAPAPSSPRPPPDPKRYIALWSSDCNDVEGTRNPQRGGDDSSPASLNEVLDELELAAYNQRICERIEFCQRMIAEYENELDGLRQELDARTVVPRLLGRDGSYYWNHVLPKRLKYDKALAWALIRAATAREDRARVVLRSGVQDYYHEDEDDTDEDDDDDDEDGLEYNDRSWKTLPVQFQEMIWKDRKCPLRKDRDLLLAILDKGLSMSVRIPWTTVLANDRGLLIKIFQTCPWCLDNAKLPAWCLKDPELFRAFADSPSLRWYRERLGQSDDRIVYRFSLDLRRNSAVLVELVRTCVETRGRDRWAANMVKRHLGLSGCQPSDCEDILQLSQGFAERMSSVTWRDYHRHCPLQYSDLSERLRGSRDVVLAFIRVDASVTSDVPDALKGDFELWKDAAKCTPRYRSIKIPAPAPLFPSKMFCLLLLEDAKEPFVRQPYFPEFPKEAARDRDVAMQMLRHLAHKGDSTVDKRVLDKWGNDRDFWLELAEVHHCHVFAWRWIPEPIQADPSVVRVWARHASEVEAYWIVKNVLGTDLLSDRQVLLNCLPPTWSDDFTMHRNEDRRKIWKRIDPAVLDYPLWLDLLPRCDGDRFERLITEDLKRDPAIVRARLSSTMKDMDTFVDMYCCTLPIEMQLQYVDVLLEKICGMNSKKLFKSRLYYTIPLGVIIAPEVAHTLLSKGWSSEHDRFEDAMSLAEWRDDPDFLLSIAERHSVAAFWDCCPEYLRDDKELLLKVVRVDARVWTYLEDEYMYAETYKYDFDVLVAALCQSADSVLSGVAPLDAGSRRDVDRCTVSTERIAAFAREVRRHLNLYASIETVMAGTRSRRTATVAGAGSPLALLDQDRYTKNAFKGRLAALLDAPSNELVASLRCVSNALSRYGF